MPTRRSPRKVQHVRGPEHLGIAVVTTGAALFAAGHGHVELAAPTLAVVSAACTGSLVPDIDHPRAWISNRIPATLFAFGLVFLLWFEFTKRSVASGGSKGVGASLGAPLIDMARPLLGWAWLALALGVVLLSVAMLVAAFVEHRGPTHSLTVGAALTLIACLGFALAALPWTLGLWFGWGYLSHLLADLTTPMGCPALAMALARGRSSDVALGQARASAAKTTRHARRKSSGSKHLWPCRRSKRDRAVRGRPRESGVFHGAPTPTRGTSAHVRISNRPDAPGDSAEDLSQVRRCADHAEGSAWRSRGQ